MRIGSAITGFEALARWRQRERGLVPPNVFIPLAEESGTILPISEWILREACREPASWPRPLNIAINLSPVQFRDGDLPTLAASAGNRNHGERADWRFFARLVDYYKALRQVPPDEAFIPWSESECPLAKVSD